MMSRIHRKPIGNFFIKKSLQIRLIRKIMVAALISTLVSSGSLILVYFLKYKTVIVYQLDKLSQELNREHIIFLILPALLISALVSVLVSFGIGLYSSRKYAVPIYKLEQWAALLRSGKMGALLRFREKEEMKELSDRCNHLAAEFRQRFEDIRQRAEQLKLDEATKAAGEDLESVLVNLDLSSPIEVNTGYFSVAGNPARAVKEETA